MKTANRIVQYLEFERSTFKQWARNLFINCLPDFWIVNRYLRPNVARMLGLKCGSGVILQKGIFYGNPSNFSIGNKSIICRGAFLDGYDKITIGNNVSIAFQVTFITSSHELGSAEKREGRIFGDQIIVEDGVWVAARAIIGPGTVVGAGSVIAAGAALMHSVPANSLVAGVPARVIKRLEDNRAMIPTSVPVAAPPAMSESAE